MRAGVAILVGFGLSACAARESLRTVPSAAGCALPPVACSPWSEMRLPLSTSEEAIAPGRPLVIVKHDGLAFGERTFVPFDAHRERGFAPSFKTEGSTGTVALVVTPLLTVLEKNRPAVASAGGLVVAVDMFAPYRAVVETLVTARYAGIGAATLLATHENGTITGTTVEVPAKAAHPPAAFAVFLDHDGIAVRTARGNLARGCAAVGPGVAIPILRGPKENRHDYAALASCAARIRSEWIPPDDDARASITATPSADFREIVRALDAIRPSFAKLQLELPLTDHE